METDNDHRVTEYPELICKGCFFSSRECEVWVVFPAGNLKSVYFLLKLFLNALFQAWYVLSSAVLFCFSVAAILQFSQSKMLWSKRRVTEITHSGREEGERQPVLSGLSGCWCLNLRTITDLLLLLIPEKSHSFSLSFIGSSGFTHWKLMLSAND